MRLDFCLKSLVVLFVLILAGCALSPTKIFQQNEVQRKTDLVLESAGVVIDARPAFKFSLGSVPGALNLDWESFSQQGKNNQGYLDQDLFFIARRLASYGISPNTSVLVLGEATSGSGQEGRLVWMLKYLGVKNVKWDHIDNYRRDSVGVTSPPHESVPVWKPVVDESLSCDLADLVAASKMVSLSPPIVIDVRSAKEYLADSSQLPAVINIPWTDMIDAKGRPKRDLKEKMIQMGFKQDTKYFVISNNGLRSAYALMVLRDIGYEKATHFPGGYQALIKR